jgi:hypothetical protein
VSATCHLHDAATYHHTTFAHAKESTPVNMAGFFGKIISWFAQDVIVKTLAENRQFQRLALRIDSFLTNKQDTIKEAGKEYLKQGEAMMKEGAKKVHETTTQKAGFDFAAFAKAFREEIQKDIQQMQQKGGGGGGSTSTKK